MSKVISLREIKNKRYNLNKYLFITVGLLFAILFVIFQLFKMNFIDVVGNQYYTDEEILNIVGINKQTNLLMYKISPKKLTLELYPYIENIEIKYLSYNKIVVEVEENKIISYIQYMGKYLCLDKNGFVLDYISDYDENIPIIEGLSFKHFIIGDKLQIDNNDIFYSILEINQNMLKYNIQVDRIDFNFNNNSNIELIIGDVEVLLGNTLNSNLKFSNLKEALQYITEEESGLLDLSNPSKKFFFKKNN